MGKDSGFSYTYSAANNHEIQKIREKYIIPKEESKFEELKRLDRQVQTSGIVPSLTVGILGFLLFGLGICMAAKIIGGNVILGVLFGFAGFITMLFAYPVYSSFYGKAKDKFVPRILELTSELVGGN